MLLKKESVETSLTAVIFILVLLAASVIDSSVIAAFGCFGIALAVAGVIALMERN